MDQDATWGHCQLQLANWDIEEPAPEDWSCAAVGLVEHMSIDMIGNSIPQAYLPQSCAGHGQELAEYYSYYAAASQPNWPAAEAIDGQNRLVMGISSKQAVELQNEETKISNNSIVSAVFDQVSHEFRADASLMEQKMHRYPASLRDRLHDSYTVPRFVAIGPYHHHSHLKQAEKVKHMAAICCVIESPHQAEDVYSAVASAADDVRCLYDKDVMAGISCVDFRDMMFFDACFLVQYMLMRSDNDIDQSLLSFLSPNRIDIQHDVMLLENQLPWQVVETLMSFRSVPNLPIFIISFRSFLQDQEHEDFSPDKDTLRPYDTDYRPPHHLGLFRHDIVGTSDKNTNKQFKMLPEKVSFSASAMELAKIGITLKAKNTTGLIRMGLDEGTLLAELSVPPLYLDRNRASYLVNMAALELCTVQSFGAASVEDSAVCSYLLLLAMLLYKEEDVDELRARGILEGGGGLTNQEALRFFTSLQGLRLGKRYYLVMVEVSKYKKKRRTWTNSYAYFYKNRKTIWKVVAAVVAFVTIITPIFTFLPPK